MDWVDRPKNYKGLYGILQLLQGSHLNNFSLKTLKLGWVAFHPRTFQLTMIFIHKNSYIHITTHSTCLMLISLFSFVVFNVSVCVYF